MIDTLETSPLLWNALPHFIRRTPIQSSKPHLSATAPGKPSRTSCLRARVTWTVMEHICSGFQDGNSSCCHSPWEIRSPEREPQSVQMRGERSSHSPCGGQPALSEAYPGDLSDFCGTQQAEPAVSFAHTSQERSW